MLDPIFRRGALLAIALSACASPRPATTLPPPPAIAPTFLIADADLNRDPRPVDAAGALADLDLALRAFDEAYAGLDGEPRLPPPATIAATRRRLASQDRWAPTALAEELRSLLGRPDGHLAFGYGGRAPLKLTTLSPQNALAAIPSPEPLDLLAPTPLFESAERMKDRAPAEPEAPPRSAPRRPIRATTPLALTSSPVPILAIHSLDPAARLALADLPAIARDLRHKPAFIIDLRGNTGGDYALAEAFILALTDRTLRKLDEREVRSTAAAEGRANSARRRIIAGEVPPDARPTFDAHIAAREGEARALCAAAAPRAEIITRGATIQGHADSPLRARAVFLIDRGCASACEMMVALARQIPGVILAGEHTRGGMAVGELALFRLPASGVTLSLGTRAFHDPSGDFQETRGYLPDVPLEGPDLLAQARLLALGLGPPGRPLLKTP